jgi:hypothetical protein
MIDIHTRAANQDKVEEKAIKELRDKSNGGKTAPEIVRQFNT